jgi:hypothetical protein
MNLEVRRRLSVFSITLLTALLVAPVSSVAATGGTGGTGATSYSGRATVVRGNVLGLPITLADTGEVSPGGGSLESTILEYPISGVSDLTGGALRLGLLHTAVVAGGAQSRAEASVASFSLNAVGQSISTGFLMARATAQCQGSNASASGSSQVLNLEVNGTPIVVTGEVNQTVQLPGGGAVIINEQVGGANANRGDLTMNALHIKLPGLLPGLDTDLIISQARAGIQCANSASCSKDFMTGGGFLASGASKQHFAVAGGIKQGAFWGHLMYMDSATGLKVKGTGVTAYTVTGTKSRHIEGTAQINGAPGTYRVDAVDNGEPGRTDTFKITLSNGYTATGTLAGGNLQLHTCK